ncbi:hypothetical protein PVA17_24550 [Lysinibacillus sp. CNPSo 3705]|uniref:ABC-three component system middle component 2 n=1 Tax=Lysinibacillus sp. CNPSo 3705 TaxID=3028148 RepID=UPI002363BDE0|nr:ABC-three component system middle component 2 [Lysinibacillus sp. CNPSo 3705]MDD1505888.1 hypothetical protein [Lysinibacillus sp. CNPSo 3705]
MSNTTDNLFNSSLEVALRILVLLNRAESNNFDIDRLVIFDYFILHRNDIDKNQESIHPPLPHRSSEIIIRRKLVQEGLDVLISRGLISTIYHNTGVFYSANRSTSLFVDLLKSTYFSKLTLVVEWVLSKYGNVSTPMLNKIINENIHIWGGEFEYEALVRSTYEQ